MSYSEMKMAKCASLSNSNRLQLQSKGMQKRKHSSIVKNSEFTSKDKRWILCMLKHTCPRRHSFRLFPNLLNER